MGRRGVNIETKEYRIGDSAQRLWAKVMAGRGHLVLPVYDLIDRDPSTKAPIAFLDDGLIVAPDLLVCTGANNMWHDVKAKSKPTFRRVPPGPRWEHGIDWAIAKQYQEVELRSGMSMWVIVHELESPDGDQLVQRENAWFGIPISRAFYVGDHRLDWPGGKAQPNRRGKDGQGGLLWGRNAMTPIQVSRPGDCVV